MMKRKRGDNLVLHNTLLFAVLGLYIVILLALLFLKASSARSVNLIPFHTIAGYLFGDKPLAISNVVGNVVLFIPLGVYLTLLNRNKGVLNNLLWIVLISVSVEIVQYFIQAGAADIDDVILNGTGGLLGIVFHQCLSGIYKDKVRYAIEVISLIVGILFLFVSICLWTGVFGIFIRII